MAHECASGAVGSGGTTAVIGSMIGTVNFLLTFQSLEGGS
ncbi:hypothetical protein [Azospirillum argentinense]